MQFIWLLEWPLREEIFPAALPAHGADSKPRGDAFPVPFSLLQPLPREGDTLQHLCRGSPPVPWDGCPQLVEYFPKQGEKEEVSLGQQLAVSSQTRPSPTLLPLSLLLSAQTSPEREEWSLCYLQGSPQYLGWQTTLREELTPSAC